MKYSIGDIVQTTASTSPPRRVGKVIVGGDTLPYRVEFLDGHAEWFYESELRPYKKKSERKKVECDCRCHGTPFASYKDKCFHCKPATREEEKKEKEESWEDDFSTRWENTPVNLRKAGMVQYIKDTFMREKPEHTCEWRHLRSMNLYDTSDRRKSSTLKAVGTRDIFYCIFNPEERREV